MVDYLSTRAEPDGYLGVQMYTQYFEEKCISNVLYILIDNMLNIVLKVCLFFQALYTH
jgi:hypothetical protein